VIDRFEQVFDVWALFERSISERLSSLFGDLVSDLFAPPGRLPSADVASFFQFVKARVNVAGSRPEVSVAAFLYELCQFVTAHRTLSEQKVEHEERVHFQCLPLKRFLFDHYACMRYLYI